jgi:hypothetical protein
MAEQGAGWVSARLVSNLVDSRPVQLQAGWEKPVEGHPVEAGQARLQVSRHAKWWGSR